MPAQLSIMDVVLGHRTHKYNKQIYPVVYVVCSSRCMCILYIYIYKSKQQQLNLLMPSLAACSAARIDGIDGGGVGRGLELATGTSLPLHRRLLTHATYENATSKSFVTRRLQRTVSMSEQWTRRRANKHPTTARQSGRLPHVGPNSNSNSSRDRIDPHSAQK